MNSSATTILIVDDNKKNILSMHRIRREVGYSVQVANDGRTALDMLKETPVDLVLLDVVMPEMDGYEVLRQIREQMGDHIPVLLASGEHTEGWDAARGLNIGADDYMVRPIDTTELNARIVSKLRVRALEKQARAAQQEAEAQNSLLHKVLRTIQAVAGHHMTDTFGQTIVTALREMLEDETAYFWEADGGIYRALPISHGSLPRDVTEPMSTGRAYIRVEERVYLPLRLQDRVAGVVELAWEETFPERVQTILATLADSLVILLQNNLYFQQITRESTFNALLNRLAAQETPLNDIFDELHQYLNATLLLFSRNFTLLAGDASSAFVEPGGDMATALAEFYRDKKIVEELVIKRQPLAVSPTGVAPTHQLFPVFSGGELIAVLIVIPPDESLEALFLHSSDFDRTARFLASVLQRRREMDIREQSRRATFLREFLAGTLANDVPRPTLFLRATALGLNLAYAGAVARIILPNFDELVDWGDSNFERRTEELLTPILRQARRTREALQLEGMEVILGESVVVVLSLPNTTTEENARRKLLQWADQFTRATDVAVSAQTRPVVGVGRYVKEWHEFPRSANEAERAAQWAASTQNSPFSYYGDLGSERLIAAIGDRQELARFYEEQLGELLHYDSERRGQLLQTLEAFFTNGMHLKQTSEALTVHANTLKYRLDQIAQLTGRDPRDPQTSLDYQLALKIRRIL